MEGQEQHKESSSTSRKIMKEPENTTSIAKDEDMINDTSPPSRGGLEEPEKHVHT